MDVVSITLKEKTRKIKEQNLYESIVDEEIYVRNCFVEKIIKRKKMKQTCGIYKLTVDGYGKRGKERN